MRKNLKLKFLNTRASKQRNLDVIQSRMSRSDIFETRVMGNSDSSEPTPIAKFKRRELERRNDSEEGKDETLRSLRNRTAGDCLLPRARERERET